jgi:putative membrane protein
MPASIFKKCATQCIAPLPKLLLAQVVAFTFARYLNRGMTMLLAKILVAFLAIAQFGFMFAEMYRWPKVAELLTKMSLACVKESEALGANMGLYNGFLAAGLLWSLLAPDVFGRQLAMFFVICVVIAAAYGAYSISKRLLLIQGSPAILALIALLIFWSPLAGAAK